LTNNLEKKERKVSYTICCIKIRRFGLQIHKIDKKYCAAIDVKNTKREIVGCDNF